MALESRNQSPASGQHRAQLPKLNNSGHSESIHQKKKAISKEPIVFFASVS
jgi:hypothetical protein